ncbi:hypothetical protein IVB25_09125 [Bradyrhizobium sp. 193]|nr:hypothetical protein [Bradyrhizobium sp. 193]
MTADMMDLRTLLEKTPLTGISKSQVSRLCGEIECTSFLSRVRWRTTW